MLTIGTKLLEVVEAELRPVTAIETASAGNDPWILPRQAPPASAKDHLY